MTKKEMIKKIQLQEATLFLRAKQYEFDYGREDGLTQNALQKWIGVNNMMESLGISTDATLPEARDAGELIYKMRVTI
jgi:hypothetical protein